MEPRYIGTNAGAPPARFVGPFEQFDLYLAEFASGRCWVRVAWSSGPDEYESYQIEGRRLQFAPVWDVLGAPTQKDLILIEHYLSLFVPELGIKSRYMERITDGT